MIFVDYRAGSKELIDPLRTLGIEVEKTTLAFGDLMFTGRGLKGAAVDIGIEFKKLTELVESLRTERLQGYQMKGMRLQYDYSYLLIEGELLYDHTGALQKRKGRKKVTLPGQMTAQELLKRKNVLHLCGGLNPIVAVNREDTLQEILALYRTWTDCDLDRHKSHIAMYEAPPLTPISDFRRTVRTFPHIGMKGSLAVEKYFGGNLKRAVMAPPNIWASLETVDERGKKRRIGTANAERIVKFCNGGK